MNTEDRSYRGDHHCSEQSERNPILTLQVPLIMGIIGHSLLAQRVTSGTFYTPYANSAKTITPLLVCRVLITRTSWVLPILSTAWLTTIIVPSER